MLTNFSYEFVQLVPGGGGDFVRFPDPSFERMGKPILIHSLIRDLSPPPLFFVSLF